MPGRRILMLLALVAAIAASHDAPAAEPRHLSFAYEEPRNTGHGIAAGIFADKLTERSNGAVVVDQFPGAQLGRDPLLLQKVRSGEIDVVSGAIGPVAALAPPCGVLSLHFLFRSNAHLQRALADPAVLAAVRDMAAERVRGARVLALTSLGLRSLYGKKEVRGVADLAGVTLRVPGVQAVETQFRAYGAQPVYLPFRDVHAALRTGGVDMAENVVGVYRSTRHFEVAPILSLTQHEAQIGVLWISDKAWSGLSVEQKAWVQAAADAVRRKQPAKALRLDEGAAARLQRSGVSLVKDVDKSGFFQAARPLQDQLARELGPQAVRLLELVRGID